MDYASLLTPAGLVLRRANSGRAWVGNVSLNFESGRPVVATQTRIGTPLYDVGVDAGTTIDSIDGRAVSSQAEWDAVLAAHRPGDQLEVAFTVRGESRRGRMGLVEDPTLEIVTFESVGRAVTPEVVKFRESWVGSHAR
jgi:predicted metalloprotease with PDZ domain